MDNNKTILEELNEICPAVANLSRENVYAVPFGYFDQFAENLLKFIRQEQRSLPKEPVPFSVPPGYFDGLADQILHKVKRQPAPSEVQEELDQIAPLLNTISKEPVYSVPVGYFEGIEINVLKKQPAKIKRLFGYTNRMVKYAAAAVVGAVMLTGSVLFLNKDKDFTDHSGVAHMSYKPEQIKTLTDEEIIEYLDANGTGGDVSTSSLVDPDADALKTLLKDVSDQEIKQYLKENAETDYIYSKEG